MTWIWQIALIIHVAAAAVWFGTGIRLTSQIRTALGVQAGDRLPVLEDVDRTRRIVLIAAVTTFLFSLIAFFGYGGFAAYGGRYHASLGLIVVMLLIEWGGVQRTWSAIRSALTDDDVEEARSYMGRLGMWTGMIHLLWIVILVLMVWRP